MRLALFLLMILSPIVAQAHPGHEPASAFASGFLQGFLHPLSGADHLMAMIAVGLLAAQLGFRAFWLVPAAFLAMMALGAALSMAGSSLFSMTTPYIETAIALSLIVFGALVASGRSLPIVGAMAIASLFALFHGFAHGAEMPQNMSGAAYAAGFLLTTAMLIALGAFAGYLALRVKHARLPQIVGATVTCVGLGAMISWL